ncbi:MAG: AI-2E family transporter [Candidatus Sungbacteria bacterium]|uniref:AI-2E family transporter n=1 Tax=Candidatus Sungiibacteriota bacterium TaxID=2750080 RepID=A0A931SBZ0_9BACT|nr:AI-2E family transporter [Candidatus Sungbacteria bacterium]
MASERQLTEISTWTIIRVFAAALGIFLAYHLREILAVLLFAIVLASAMEPTIRWFQERKIPRILSTLIIFLSAFGVIFLAVYLLIPLLAADLEGFNLSYSVFERQILGELGSIGGVPFIDFIRENARGILLEPSQYISSISGGVFAFTSTFFGGVFSFVILVVVSFYLAAQEKGIEGFIRLVTPLKYESYAVDLWLRSQRKMGQWLRAQLLLGALIGAVIYVGLTLLDIKYALVFAFLAGILELVPVVGPILSAAPPTLVAFLQSPFLALMVIILFVVVQQLESHVVVPVIMRQTIGIPPIVVIIALLVGAKLAGVLGLLLAVPIAAVIVELVNDFDRRKRAAA